MTKHHSFIKQMSGNICNYTAVFRHVRKRMKINISTDLELSIMKCCSTTTIYTRVDCIFQRKVSLKYICTNNKLPVLSEDIEYTRISAGSNKI